MKKKERPHVPLLTLLMVAAGLVTCLITYGCRSPVETKVIALSSDQKVLIEKFGYPDSFLFMVAEDKENQPGKMSRFENWNYYDLQTSFSFTDGGITGSIEIDDVLDGTILPVDYRPDQFYNLTHWEEVKEKIIEERPYGKTIIPTNQLPDTTLVDSEQILMGFEKDKLFYVETIPLEPDEDFNTAGGL